MRKIIFMVLGAIMLGLIFTFSSCDAPTSSKQSALIVNWVNKLIPVNSFFIRKCAHFSLYLVLEVIIYFICAFINLKYPGLISLLFVSIYAISDEIHQYFVPGRSCEIRDMLIDISGAIVALIIIKLWR